jgi:hypothetical protein
MTAERVLNSYRNASPPPSPELRGDLARFMVAADPILAEAAELARVVACAHQAAATQLIGEDWTHARSYFSLSERYAAWTDYRVPAIGFGIHACVHTLDRPFRLTDEELRTHPEWRNFGDEVGRHPPMRGWLAVPLVGSDGTSYGSIQASDRLSGDFTEQDEVNLVRLGTVTAAALGALAQVTYGPPARSHRPGVDRGRARGDDLAARGCEGRLTGKKRSPTGTLALLCLTSRCHECAHPLVVLAAIRTGLDVDGHVREQFGRRTTGQLRLDVQIEDFESGVAAGIRPVRTEDRFQEVATSGHVVAPGPSARQPAVSSDARSFRRESWRTL